jgi:hypothetical protein
VLGVRTSFPRAIFFGVQSSELDPLFSRAAINFFIFLPLNLLLQQIYNFLRFPTSMQQINQLDFSFARFYLFAHFPLLPAGFFLCFSSVTPNLTTAQYCIYIPCICMMLISGEIDAYSA